MKEIIDTGILRFLDVFLKYIKRVKDIKLTK